MNTRDFSIFCLQVLESKWLQGPRKKTHKIRGGQESDEGAGIGCPDSSHLQHYLIVTMRDCEVNAARFSDSEREARGIIGCIVFLILDVKFSGF
jgi:hypothetical protein